jgi:hypothetical protein
MAATLFFAPAEPGNRCVYASQPLSPVVTQHSLPSGRYSLLGPVFHRLDRTSFAWHSLDHLVDADEHGGTVKPSALAVLRSHSITSSARARSGGGTSSPSALAVLRLMTSSNLFGACTGRLAGFSPFSMRAM